MSVWDIVDISLHQCEVNKNRIILLILLYIIQSTDHMIVDQSPPSQHNLKLKSQLQFGQPSASENIENFRRSRINISLDPDPEDIDKSNGLTVEKVKRIRLSGDFLKDNPDVGEKFQNQDLKFNTFIFGILLLSTQIAVCLVYGFKFQVVSLDLNWRSHNQVSFQPIALTILTLLAALVGFPMLFAYNKKMIWTALLFNLFILALTIELYFIANNLINRIGINPSLQRFSYYWHIYIWNYDYHYLPDTEYVGTYYQVFGNTLVDAIKCAISNMIIYSAVLGRVGILQVFVLTFIGTIGYEFCRQILFSLGVDFGDGCSVWIYGGFAGFIIGLIQFFKNRRNSSTSTKETLLYTGSFYSTAFSMIGSTVLVILLPILCIHTSRTVFSKYPNILSNIPYTVYHSIVASIITSIGTSICINQKLVVRDFINGAIAGGIAGFNSALFISVPAYAQVVGFTAGLFQSLAQNFVQKPVAMKYDLFHSYSFSLFGIQGIIGAAFGSIFQNSSIFSTQTIVLGCIAAGLGVGFGLVIELFIFFRRSHSSWDNFHDKVYLQGPEAEPFREDESVIIQRLKIRLQFAPTFLLPD